ncbi:MAG: hypothetical protein ISS78_11430 [Phycisphaerae bacterium]|nr:hypothetical protein [Phycisphaerae bacterium]
MMKNVLLIVAVSTAVLCPPARGADNAPAGPKAYVVVFDFKTVPGPDAKTSYGAQLADGIRLKLRRHAKDGWEVIDRLSTQEFSGALGIATDLVKVKTVMTDKLAVNVGVYGTVHKIAGGAIRAEIRFVDLRKPKTPRVWAAVYSDNTERARGVVTTQIIEALRGKPEWRPPEYGDEAEPKAFGKPLNANGDFESGADGWEGPDNAATFIEPGPAGRGKVLRLQTDLERDKYIAYRRALRLGKASPADPPKLKRDTSFASLAGLEGVFYRGQWIKAAPRRRYWLVADMKGRTEGIFFPKIFVKGFRDWSARATGLPEASLAERKMTPRQFADLPAAEQKKLVADDAKENPKRYLRECFRWQLACRNERNVWTHYAAPFPPRGGLPKNVEWLQIQVYAYWPPGAFYFDNVHLHTDPRQKALLPEVKPRTPNFDKR